MTLGDAGGILASFIRDMDTAPTRSGPAEVGSAREHMYRVGVTTRSGDTSAEEITVYEFEVNSGGQEGFALVVGDVRIATVLAYVPNGTVNTEIEPAASFLKSIPLYLEKALREYDRGVSTRVYDPDPTDPEPVDPYDPDNPFADGLSELYSCYVPVKWQQGGAYNLQLPYCNACGRRMIAGCTVTAVAQVMAYHRHPAGFDWDLLTETPNFYEDETIKANEASRLYKLIWDQIQPTHACSNNNSSATLSQSWRALNATGYSAAVVRQGGGAVLPPWGMEYLFELDYRIEKSIKEGHPAILAGYLRDRNTHAYIIDAYGKKNYSVTVFEGKSNEKVLATSEYYHVNMGWGGLSDGWYLRSGLSGELIAADGNSYRDYFRSEEGIFDAAPQP